MGRAMGRGGRRGAARSLLARRRVGRRAEDLREGALPDALAQLEAAHARARPQLRLRLRLGRARGGGGGGGGAGGAARRARARDEHAQPTAQVLLALAALAALPPLAAIAARPALAARPASRRTLPFCIRGRWRGGRRGGRGLGRLRLRWWLQGGHARLEPAHALQPGMAAAHLVVVQREHRRLQPA